MSLTTGLGHHRANRSLRASTNLDFDQPKLFPAARQDDHRISHPRPPCSQTRRPRQRAIAQRFSALAHRVISRQRSISVASLIGRFGSSTFRLSTIAVSMSLTGSRFSPESAPRPFHHGIRGRGGTIYTAALPLDERQVQADMRTHLIHRPARDIFPRLGGTRVSSYCN